MSNDLENLQNFYDQLKKEFLPYELCLLLRDKGFEENCLGFYVGKNKVPHLIDEKIVLKTKFKLTSKVSLRAPLYQQVFDWFRETHNLDATIRKVDLKGRGYWNIKKISTGDKIKGYASFTTSYEQAKIDCINKLIELI